MIEFSMSVVGAFTIPQRYVKDLKIYLSKLKENNYLIDFRLFTRDYADNVLNLNFLNQIHELGLLADPNKGCFAMISF